MDHRERATAAANLLKNCISVDDQNGFDFVSSIIDSERLYTEFESDDGEPFASAADLAIDLGVRSETSGLVAMASARGGQSLQSKFDAVDSAIAALRQ